MAANVLPELPKGEVDKIVESYKTIYQNVTEIVSARVLEHRSSTSKVIISQWRQRNLETHSNLILERSILTDEYYKSAIDINSNVSRCVTSVFSPSGLLKATVSLYENKFVLDILSQEKLMATFDLHELDIHGAVYYDDTFGSLSWSPQEDKVVYVAEKKSPKTAPFYSQTSSEQSCEKKGEQYVYEEDWGEQISPKKHSVIVVCNIVQRKISLLTEGTLNDDFSAGQVIWDPTGKGVVGVGFLHQPRRLGIKYCTNRPSFIFHAIANEHYEILSDEALSVSSPRFSPDGKYLVWLQHPSGGPHQSAFALVKCDWETKNITTVVDIIETSILTSNKCTFYGIYCSSLPQRCWTSDSKLVVFSTEQIHRINAYAVHIDNKSLWDIGSGNENESTIILDVTENYFAISKITSFKQPSVLAGLNITSAILADKFDKKHFSWNILTQSPNFNDSNIITPFTVYNEEFKNSCHALYYGPGSGAPSSVPVVLFIHGGSHTSVSSSYYPVLHFFTGQGFGIVIVNYSGSLGCGNSYVYSLLGKIGKLDVKDCYITLHKSFEKFQWLDSKNVVLFGGSHGGFLATHLSAQYPNDFKSVVTRNPAVNIPAKIFLTDIPDW
ncbi:hypothetical protein V9T40_009625 [Parthenolecanium corni]|uniref:Acylamino-acid-releasing enzyme n=1 Tax=Parthenolecanium corni TaxID=536013 RepID=A0AAN9TN35_9HEMI